MATDGVCCCSWEAAPEAEEVEGVGLWELACELDWEWEWELVLVLEER